jgi:hypothetical protein
MPKFFYLGDVITKMRNRLSDSSTKAVLLIKSRTGHPEAESWETDMEHKAEDMMRRIPPLGVTWIQVLRP